MSSLAQVRDLIASELAADPRLAGVTVTKHGGAITLEDIKRYSVAAPCAVLALLRFTARDEAGANIATAHWGLAVLTRNAPEGSDDLDGDKWRSVVALADLCTRALLGLFRGAAGTPTINAPQQLTATNEFDTALDSLGIAMFAITWQQDLELEDYDPADLYDFVTAAVDYETHTRDDEALFETPEATDYVTGLQEDDFDIMAFPTQHLNIGKIGAAVVAPTPGTPDPNALAVFGQVHIAQSKTIASINLHGIEDLGTGGLTVEVYRRRAGVMTLLATLSLTGGSGDYAEDTATPAGVLALVGADDHIFAQVTDFSAGGGYDGLTVDVRFA